MEASALHQAMRWGDRALDLVEAEAHQRFGGLTGLRFNIGRVEGGIKANMIAPTAEVRFGFRALPTMNGFVFGTWRKAALAQDMARPSASGGAAFALAHNVAARAEVEIGRAHV